MSFDYLAYAIPSDLIESLKKNPEEFLNIFNEAIYAEEFTEIEEELEQEVQIITPTVAKKIYQTVQEILEDDSRTLDLDGEYWASPAHFFLSAEFDDDEVLAQPTFVIKKEGEHTLINALGGTKAINTEHNMVLLTEHEDVKSITKEIPNILNEDFKKRWNTLTNKTGQYLDVFAEPQDLDEFIADLREFMHEILLQFYQKASAKNMGIIVMFD